MERKIQLPAFLREAEWRDSSFNEEKSTIDVIWTTGATVRRRSWVNGDYDEELIVSRDAVRLARLNAGAPFLNSHDSWDLSSVIGSVVRGSARVENGQGLATIQLSRTPGDAEIVQKIRDGNINNISVGYVVHRVEKIEADDGTVPLWRAIDWEPMEISAVPIPADPGAQVRAARNQAPVLYPCIEVRTDTITVRRVRMRMKQKRA